MENAASIVKEACLLSRCLAVCHILARVGSPGNVFTESLLSSGSIRHNIVTYCLIIVRLRGNGWVST
jgi:hypothetical protein